MWKANKVEVGEYDVLMNDFQLCTLETARSQMSAVPGPLIQSDFCVTSPAKRHKGITLSSVCSSVCLFIYQAFITATCIQRNME